MQPLVDLGFAHDIVPILLRALLVTLQIALMSSALAVTLGLLGFLAQQAPFRPFAIFIRELLQFIRSTPLLIQIYFFYFGSSAIGLAMDPLWAGSFVLGLHYACYAAEVFRSARKAVPLHQKESAEALGLRDYMLYRLVVFPQMMPVLVPGIGNAIIALIKDTPVLSAISVMEVLATTKEIGSDSFRYIEPMTMCGLMYLTLSYLLSLVVQGMCARFRWAAATRLPSRNA